MKNLKKTAALICALITLMAVLGGCGNKNNTSDKTSKVLKYKFGIITMVENGAFTDMKKGIIEGMNKAGYTDKNAVFDYQCAGGDAGTLQTIVNSMNDGTYTAVFCIATPTAQAFVNLASKTPCFFCAVSAPVAAGVITNLKSPDKNATGASNAIPVKDILSLSDTVTPGIKKWGLISSGTETNATNTITMVKEALKQKGIEYHEVFAETSSDVATAAKALVDAKCNAVFVPNDSVIQSGVSSLADICNTAAIPTYTSSATTVKSGCFSAIAIDDVEIGKLTASMCDKYIKGTPIKKIETIVCDINYCSVYINSSVKEKLGVKIPASVKSVKYINQ
ncbi:MAG: ABC transporter substrate-binding protein [Bacillota bacterium]|nr:ABC transporter substrate-binding protein [Bacillota bacterium]